MMTLMRTTGALLLGALLSVGCGGGSEEQATDNRGNTITTAGGTAVTEEAHNRWLQAVERYKAVQAWNGETCGSIRSAFEDANDAQGGNFTEAIYMMGHISQKCGDLEEARSMYQRALETNGEFCKARAAIGTMQLNDGDQQAAYATFQQAIRDDARCTEAYVNLAVIQRQRGGAEVREALNNLRRALAIESEYLPAFNQMALLYLDQAEGNEQMLDLASVVCRQAQLIDRDYAPIYNTWGLINVRKEEIIEALRMFERATNLDDDMFEAHMNFGQITLSFRGYEDAKNAFSRAVELQPNDYDAHIGLGAAFRGLGQMDQAEAQYERAMELDGNRPEAYFNLGLLYQDYKSGSIQDLQRAKQFYEQFLNKVGSSEQFSETVEEVRRRCRQQNSGRRRRRRSTDCRPGRLQNIATAVEALQAQAEMQRQMQQNQGGGDG